MRDRFRIGNRMATHRPTSCDDFIPRVGARTLFGDYVTLNRCCFGWNKSSDSSTEPAAASFEGALGRPSYRHQTAAGLFFFFFLLFFFCYLAGSPARAIMKGADDETIRFTLSHRRAV